MVLELKNIHLVADDKEILKDVSFDVQEGERVTIVGPSGSGKSSVLKLLSGLISVTDGQILYDGASLDTLNMATYRQSVSYCFQQPVLFGKTVKDNFALPFKIRNVAFDEQRVLSAIESVGLSPEFLMKPVISLSGGEKQRVALMRNLLFMPRVLLLDEVTAGLDAMTKEVVNRVITEYHQSGHTIIEVTHDQSEIDKALRLITIEGGRFIDDKCIG